MTLPSEADPPPEDELEAERSLSKAITSDWIKREETGATSREPAVHRRPDGASQSASGATPPAEVSGPLLAGPPMIAEPAPRRGGAVIVFAAGLVAAGVLAFAMTRSPSPGGPPSLDASATGSTAVQTSPAERVAPSESQQPSASPVQAPEVAPATALAAVSSATGLVQAARSGSRPRTTAAQPSAVKTSGRDAYIPPAAFPR